MTDKIGIDEQIARIKRRVELERELEQLEIGDLPIYLAVLETLRGYKRIMEAKVPEKPDVGRMSDLNALGTMIDAYDTLLDLLRRETAKNERIVELLREPSEGMIHAGLAAEGHIDDEFKAMSAALLAEVEKDNHD